MPFGERSSNSYGTSNNSSNSSNSYSNSSGSSVMNMNSTTRMTNRRQSLSDTPQQQQQQQQKQPPPLRSRQPHHSVGSGGNASTSHGGSPSPTDLLFSHPHSSFDEFPYPPYSELPFTSLKRRKTLNAGNQFVKWAMRTVLASPVIVLILWSIGAMIFSKNVSHKMMHRNNSNHNNNNNNNSNNMRMMNARMMRRMADPSVLPLQAQAEAQPIMTPYGLLLPVQQQQQQQQLQQQAQPMYGMATTTTNNNNMGYIMAPPQQQQQLPSVPMMQQQPPMQMQRQMPQPGFGMPVSTMMQMQQQQQQLQQQPLSQEQAQLQAQQSSMGATSYYGMAAAPAYGTSTTTQTSYDSNLAIAFPSENPPPPMVTATTMESMPYSMQAGNGVVMQPPGLQQQAEPSLLQQQQQEQQQPLQSQRMAMAAPLATQGEPGSAQTLIGSTSSFQEFPPSQLQSQPARTTTTTTILYYDPQQTSTDVHGQVRLPTVVYDAQGNPMDLAHFVATQEDAQIFLEAPPPHQTRSIGRGQATQAAAFRRGLEEPSRGQAASTTGRKLSPEDDAADAAVLVDLDPMGDAEAGTAPRTLMVEESSLPESALATPSSLQRWGESTTQDQNIIVATVAVMALLVGALSARRLRSRSVLSACIENESLEDDVAYDAAYSTTLHEGSSSYNTFGGAGGMGAGGIGWKGDLEKFDV